MTNIWKRVHGTHIWNLLVILRSLSPSRLMTLSTSDNPVGFCSSVSTHVWIQYRWNRNCVHLHCCGVFDSHGHLSILVCTFEDLNSSLLTSLQLKLGSYSGYFEKWTSSPRISLAACIDCMLWPYHWSLLIRLDREPKHPLDRQRYWNYHLCNYSLYCAPMRVW